jgi:Raf kinase inhibitor-like YbhB/YbcL family protein
MRGVVAAGVVALAAAAAGAVGCGDEKSGAKLPATQATMRLTSPALRNGATMPRRFTCDGSDVSPPLTFSAPPHGTRELAVVVEDLDADRFLHWTLLGVRPTAGGLRDGEVPAGAVQTKNGFGKHAYGGPCPPKGDDPHRYLFSVYALDAPLGLDADASPDDVGSAIAAHDLARGTLTATYARS